MTWERMPIGDLLQKLPNKKVIQQGWSPKCHTHPAAQDKWGVLKTTSIQAGRFLPDHNKELPEELAPRPNIEIEVGDLLLTCAGPRARCGVPALVRATPNRLMMSGKMYRLRPDERLDPRFLELFLLSDEAQQRIDEMKTGISDSGLNLTHGRFVQLPVPVPPLPEQHRIVAIIEDHLSRLDAADTYLGQALRGANTLRTVTLARLHEWPTATLTSLATDAGYGTSEKCVADGPGPAVVRIPNLIDGTIDLTDEKRVATPGVDVAKSMLSEGDLLIVRTNGSLDLIGRSAVAPANLNAAFASYLIRYRLRPEVVRPRWVNAMLSTPQLRLKIEKLAASSAGQHNLSLVKLGSLAIPLPSLSEQDQLLDTFSSLDADRKRLSNAIVSARSRSTALRRSVLAAAFSGRLTGSSNEMSEVAGMTDA